MGLVEGGFTKGNDLTPVVEGLIGGRGYWSGWYSCERRGADERNGGCEYRSFEKSVSSNINRIFDVLPVAKNFMAISYSY